jgi:hypothetical protein
MLSPTAKKVLLILFFPLLIMVRPKLYFPWEEPQEPLPGGSGDDSTKRL